MHTGYAPSTRVRCLVDADCFFVSCARWQNPQLLGRPVCVGEQIIVAVSYEAKAYGVHVGMPIREAKKILPSSAIFCKPTFALYTMLSQQMASNIATWSPTVYQASIDEMYVDITDTKPNGLTRETWCQTLQQDLMARTNLPVTLGCWPTPLLAKLFATLHKPQGCGVILDPADIIRLLRTCPIHQVPGIGPKTQKKIDASCTDAYSFMQRPLSTVKAHFGVQGIQVWHGLHGHALASHITAPAHPKSISASRSFPQALLCTLTVLWPHLLWHREQVYAAMISQHLQTNQISIGIRDASLHRERITIPLPSFTIDKWRIQTHLKIGLEQCMCIIAKQYCRWVGMWVHSVVQTPWYTPGLFDDQSKKHHTLTTCMQGINKQRWKTIIAPASMLKLSS